MPSNSFNGQDLFTWLGCFGAVLLLLNQALSFWHGVSGKPSSRSIVNSPLEVKESAEYVSRHDFEVTVQEWRKIHDKLETRIDHTQSEMMKQFREDMKGLHDKVNEVAKSVAGQAATTGILNQLIAQLNSEMTQLNSRKPS